MIAMKCQLALILLVFVIGTFTNSSVQPKKKLGTSTESKCNVNNNYNNFYAGEQCCEKIEQQLAEIKEAIAALRNDKSNESEGL